MAALVRRRSAWADAPTQRVTKPATDQHDQAKWLLERFATHAVSAQLMNTGLQHWFSANGHAVIGYVDVLGTRVTAGPPVCAPCKLADAARAFVSDTKRGGKKSCFFGVDQPTAGILSAAIGGITVTKVGELPEWNPKNWQRNARRHRTLRRQSGRALRKGVTIKLATQPEIRPGGQLFEQAAALLHSWRRAQRMAPLGFVAGGRPFDQRAKRNFLVATRGQRLVGLLSLLPLSARRGWLFEDLVRCRQVTPNGTMELLIDHAMRWLATQDAHYATLGLVPLAGSHLDADQSRWIRAALRVSKCHLGQFYNFDGLRRFREKLLPDRWADCYLASTTSELRSIAALLGAFCEGRPLSFLARTITRRIESGL